MGGCTQCGAALGPDDLFCAVCGARSEPAVVVSRLADVELLGTAAPNQHYLGHRLVYSEAEILDPVSPKFIRAIWFHFGVMFLVGFLVAIPLAILVIIAGKLGILLMVCWFLVVAGVILFAPISASISEWKFMIDGKAASGPAAFAHVANVLSARRTPAAKVGVQRLRLGGSATRDYFYVHDGVFRAYVSCVPYGNDLYVGWTFWWRLSLFRWVLVALRRIIQTVALRGNEVYALHRYDYAKALRETVHSATREGLDVATQSVTFSAAAGTIGSNISIDEVLIPDQAL